MPKEQDVLYIDPLRRYYDSCNWRDRYDDILLAAVELCDDQIGDGALQALMARNPQIVPDETFFDTAPREAKERFTLLPLELLADVVEGHCDDRLEQAWLSTTLVRIRRQSVGHDLEQCLDDEAHVYDHGCRNSQLCPIKYVRNFLVADSYIGGTEASIGLQVDQLYTEWVANYKRDWALQHNLISKATHEQLEIDYYNAHYPKLPRYRAA